MRTIKDFKDLTNTEYFTDESEVFIEMQTGELYEVMGFQPTDKHGAVILHISPRPHDYRKSYMGE